MIDDCAQLLAASVFFSQVGDEPVNIFLVLTVNIFELVGIRYGHYSAIIAKKLQLTGSLLIINSEVQGPRRMSSFS